MAMNPEPEFVKRRNPRKLTLEDGPMLDNSVVEVNPAKLEELELSNGEFVLLLGKRSKRTLAVIQENEDLELNQISVSRCLRENLHLKLGMTTILQMPEEVSNIQRVEISPNKKSIEGIAGDLVSTFLLPYLKGQNRPIFEGDVFTVSGNFKTIQFKVTAVEPEEFGVFVDTTELHLGDPIELDEDKSGDIGYDDLGGIKPQIAIIREMVELPLRHPAIFEQIGINPPKGILMMGPPGCGKTMIAKAIANETGAYFYVINGPEIMSKTAGKAEENLRKAFEETAANAPAILFIDEIDSIAPRRDKVGGEVEKRIVSQLLTCMDGVKGRGKVVVIAATNRPNAIDGALRRFGRFDKEIDIGVPDETGRIEI